MMFSSVVDISLITLTVGGLQDILTKEDTLRENILYLLSFELLVNKNEEICK